MVRHLLYPPYLPPDLPHPEQTPVPPLKTVVFPPPIVPEKGVSQVREGIPPRPVPPQWSNIKSSRRTYFKAMASAKKAHWSDFFSSATPHSLWTAKRFAFGHPPHRFLDLPGASNSTEVAETLLHHFFPPKPPPPPPPCLERHEDYTPLTFEEVSRALSKSSNTSAPGPDHIPYSV